MIAIKQAVDAPQYLEELSEWFVQEWSELDPLQGQYPDFKIPSPLVALNEDGQLVGGLAFTMAPLPETNELRLWINALLVAPEYRRQRVASRLIASAEQAAARHDITELYVYWTCPGFVPLL